MAYSAPTNTSTTTASFSHLAAATGPVVPLLLYVLARRRDAFVSTEAAKATNFATATLAAFVIATLIRLYVPLVGFIGTLAQWVVPVVAIYFSLAGFWTSRHGNPAQYPFQLEVVKTDD